jgi:oligosaccharide 4-alpha-D-glucosyltransferase
MKKYTLLFFCFLSLVAFSQKKKVTSKKTPAVIQKVEIPVQPKVEPCVERTFVAFEKQADNLVKLKVCDGNYQIKFVSDRIVETVFEPLGDASKSASHIVENKAGVTFRVEELDNIIWLKTFSLWVKIQKKPFNISYHKREDYLFSEGKGYHKPDSLHQINLKISSDEVLYGGGARVLGMNRRGNKLPLFNKAKYGYETKAEQMNFCLPIFLSSKIYMVHFDNPTTGFLDLDSQNKNEVNFDFHSGRKVYQVVIGNNWEELVSNYTELTGKQPLIPIWALGNFSSRFGYHSQDEVMKTAQAYEDAQIPVDALILDLYWFGKDIKGSLGNLSWYKEKFPDGKQMIKDLNKKGIKTILITEPFILTTSNNWQSAVDKEILVKNQAGKPATWDFYFGNTGLVDVFKKEGKNWFWQFYKNMIFDGAAGQWGDLGEPEVLPKETYSVAGKSDEFRNIYGHQWAKMVFEGYAEDFPTQRPFILMRSGYSGSQKYGMIPWSGDVNRTWGGMQGQVELSLQMGMQGLAYMHSDLGGFAGDNLDDELYVRWLQYGVFQPIFRPHAQEEVPSEPVFRSEWAKKHSKQAIDLRYRLLPYNYNLAIQNATTGFPLMRPLFFEEPDNKKLYENDKGYLWGNDFLVYPIKDKSLAQMDVYFPKSNDWVDFYTGQVYQAGTNQYVATKPESIPTFVRAGSFIPMTKWIKNTEAYNPNNIEIHFYHSETLENQLGSFSYDDGVSTKTIEEDKVSTMFCDYSKSEKSKIFRFEMNVGRGLKFTTDRFMTVDFTIHGLDKKPKKVFYNGIEIKTKYDHKLKKLNIPFIHKIVDVTIELKY